MSKHVIILRGEGRREWEEKNVCPPFLCKGQGKFSLLLQIYVKCFPCFVDCAIKITFSVSIDLGLVLCLFYRENNWGKKGIAQALCSDSGMAVFRPGVLTSVSIALRLSTPMYAALFLPKCFCSRLHGFNMFPQGFTPFYKQYLWSKHSWIQMLEGKIMNSHLAAETSMIT